ncbi:MAG: UbiH/UbiF family hydroxylase [Pseudomonadota bacterium]
MKYDCDILISGGGIAGLTAAAAFGTAGFHVICVEPAAPITDGKADGADMRSTALLQPARTLLEEAGLWEVLAPHAAPLQIMKIIDAGGKTPEPRVTKSFDATDISDRPFGWNFPNWLLRREMLARVNALDTVRFLPGVATTALFTRMDVASVTLSDGRRLSTRLLIAADGRHSAMRQAAGIGVRTQRYGQKALAFTVSHDLPHQNISTEIHRTGGPFTLVPLPDRDGGPHSAVVWMDDGPKTLARAHSDVPDFETEMTERSCDILGDLKLSSPRNIWPIISQQAERISAERTALIAEAAHVMPPIGAQGLNMSLADVATLLKLARERPTHLGDVEMLEAYQRARYPDIQLRMRGIGLLNRISQARVPGARDARAVGLNALYGITPLRKTLMRLGLGVR